MRSPASPSGAAASGVQDVLVFDPADGVLSLRRVTLALEAPHAAGLPISVSLPAARLSMSASPPAYAASYARGAGTNGVTGSGAESGPGELAGREAVVATWSLRRKRGWAEIRRAEMGEVNLADGPRVKEEYVFLPIVLHKILTHPQLARPSRTLDLLQRTARPPAGDIPLAPIRVLHPRRRLPRAHPAIPIRHRRRQDRRPARGRSQCLLSRPCKRRGRGVRRGVRLLIAPRDPAPQSRLIILRRAARKRTRGRPLPRRAPAARAPNASQRLPALVPQLHARARGCGTWGRRR